MGGIPFGALTNLKQKLKAVFRKKDKKPKDGEAAGEGADASKGETDAATATTPAGENPAAEAPKVDDHADDGLSAHQVMEPEPVTVAPLDIKPATNA